jgi:thiosulfate/3-mercaptopyruvate sulfurtransferase
MGLLLLYRLGYANLALYDASMAEWARDESLPIQRG